MKNRSQEMLENLAREGKINSVDSSKEFQKMDQRAYKVRKDYLNRNGLNENYFVG